MTTPSEKVALPSYSPSPAGSPSHLTPKKSRSFGPFSILALFSLLVLFAFHSGPTVLSTCHRSPSAPTTALLEAAQCPVQPKTLDIGNKWDPSTDPVYASLAAKRLSKAVQINTVSYDDLPLNASSPEYEKHHAFSHFLETEFPKLLNNEKAGITHEYVNVHGHLFTWKGSNPALKPVLLMAHTDTVPVPEETVPDWTFPPFEGAISVNATESTPGTWVWGRGVSDCKNSLMGIYGAVERLITEGYKPERTILIANGFDEEIGGPRGAGALAEVMYGRYGDDGIAFLLDEGFSAVSRKFGAQVAGLGMAEKGAVSVKIQVNTPGGHSSVPPVHTGIGITSILLSALEAHPFAPHIDPAGPFIKYLNCLSDYAPGLSRHMKRDIKNPKRWSKLAKELAEEDRMYNSFLATTQAVDLIKGGVKVNALPETVEATVNYRIDFTSSVNATLAHIEDVLKPVAKKLDFALSAIDGPAPASSRSIVLSTTGKIEPAPVSSASDPSFALMAGTCKAVFGNETVVAPTGMFANTDTKHMWKLTKNIYRFTPALETEALNPHTVDERVSLNAHLSTTRFYYKLIQNTEGFQA